MRYLAHYIPSLYHFALLIPGRIIAEWVKSWGHFPEYFLKLH